MKAVEAVGLRTRDARQEVSNEGGEKNSKRKKRSNARLLDDVQTEQQGDVSLLDARGRQDFFFFFFFAIRCCAPVDKRKDWGLGNVLDHAQGKMYLSLRTK